jgi:hypothetical protein
LAELGVADRARPLIAAAASKYGTFLISCSFLKRSPSHRYLVFSAELDTFETKFCSRKRDCHKKYGPAWPYEGPCRTAVVFRRSIAPDGQLPNCDDVPKLN